jgi:NitT/TauT family transport system ATP-binding protein
MLEFDQVTREFATPDGGTYRTLQDISLAVKPGAFVAIVGPSGCGKSTLLNIAAGLLPPTSGRVRVGGEDLNGLNRRATYMFQQDALLPWKDVRDNVALGLVLAGRSRIDANRHADEWLARVGLAGFASHYPSQLSGGMRKRVAMAQNWIIDREILLMDEPFSALDVHTRQRMETELLALWEAESVSDLERMQKPEFVQNAENAEHAEKNETLRSLRSLRSKKTVLFVTHDLEEAIALADEVVVLAAGPASHVVAQHPVGLGRPRDLFELRTSAAFVDLYRTLWAVLREEVIKSQQERSRA